jgi:hypothetical protein
MLARISSADAAAPAQRGGLRSAIRIDHFRMNRVIRVGRFATPRAREGAVLAASAGTVDSSRVSG